VTDLELLAHNLTNHSPANEDVIADMERLRFLAKTFGAEILDLVPWSRERSLALTNLEQTVMWAIAGIARNQSNE
jgi:hypothetical protein